MHEQTRQVVLLLIFREREEAKEETNRKRQWVVCPVSCYSCLHQHFALHLDAHQQVDETDGGAERLCTSAAQLLGCLPCC